jgi:hypothetical protein
LVLLLGEVPLGIAERPVVDGSSICFVDCIRGLAGARPPEPCFAHGLLELPLRRPKAFRLGESWKTRICTLDEIFAETSEKQIALL